MNFTKLIRWAVPVSLALIVGCNIFNPNASTESSCPASDVGCLVALGQERLGNQDFTGAMTAFQLALALDSTRSLAYYGYAQAVSFQYNFNTNSMLADLQKTGDGNMNAFMEHPDLVLTQRLQVSVVMNAMMDILVDRDTLTKCYEYLTDSSAIHKADPNFAARRAFITDYLAKADAGVPGYRSRAQFPLTDRIVTFTDVALEYTAYKMMYKLLDFHDLAPKGIFDDRDHKMDNILSGNGGLGNLGAITEDMKTDTALKREFNNKIVELQSGLGDVSQLLSYVVPGGVPGGQPGAGTEAQTKTKMDSAIVSLGGALVFYQFGDKLDNDADGCIDEEIVDSLDNDLDGFVDEDARLFAGDGTPGKPTDTLDNDRDGEPDDYRENKAGGLYPPRPYLLYFVGDYLGTHHEEDTPEMQTTWVKIKKDSANMDLRIAIQKDSLAVHITPGLPVPAEYQAKLANAIAVVGGCWRNYNRAPQARRAPLK